MLRLPFGELQCHYFTSKLMDRFMGYEGYISKILCKHLDLMPGGTVA